MKTVKFKDGQLIKVTPENLALFFAAIITSKHNQNLMLRFVAVAGMGKSWAALKLSYMIAFYISKILGGKSKDYFDFEKDLAVISLEEVERVMKEAKPYHVLMLDDVSAKAMNARNYQSKSSKDLNSIIQTWRPNHNCLVTTQQASFLVDKVWRNLFNFEIEIVESHFNQGFVICKVKRIVYDHTHEKTFKPYLKDGRNRYVRHIISSPPKEWQQKYEDERAKQLKRIKEKEESGEVEEPKKERLTKEKFYTPMILKIAEKGYMDQKDIMEQLFDMCGSSPSQKMVSDILNKNNMTCHKIR